MGWEEVKYRWTGEDADFAAEAKKAKQDHVNPQPKILLTPYGLSPFQFFTSGVEGGQVVIKARVYLAADATDKKALAAWDIAIGAEVMIPLELSVSGQKSMRDRFFKKGQSWIPVPDGATGNTLLELCRSLFEMRDKDPQLDVYHFFSKTKAGAGGARVDKTSAEWDAAEPIRDRILSKLVGHWKNTDYHFEQLRQGLRVGGDLAVPLRTAAGAEVKLAVVLGEPPPPAPPAAVAPQGASGDAPATGASLKVNPPAAAAAPPPPWDKLPPLLIAKLQRSFEDHKWDDEPQCEKALKTYWDRAPNEKNVWDLLNKTIDWQDVNTMVRVYQRMALVDRTGALFRDHVRYIIRAYTSGIYALEMVYEDQPKLIAYLDEITKRTEEPLLAREQGIFQCMHSGTIGWRQVSSTDQLHISVADGSAADATEDCHIDEMSFTAGRDDDGKTKPAWESGPGHFIQSQLKWIDIERPFWKLEKLCQLDESDRAPMSEETAARFKAWAEQRGSKAISGEDGHKEAVDLVNQLLDDAVKLHPEVDG